MLFLHLQMMDHLYSDIVSIHSIFNILSFYCTKNVSCNVFKFDACNNLSVLIKWIFKVKTNLKYIN